MLHRYFIFLLVVVFPSMTLAGEGERLLEQFLTQSKTMSADFVQTLRTEDDDVLQESKGHFYLSRPGKFRWDYITPYQQEIISDGQQVWIFDVDLQQVTVQDKTASINNTPMALMEGKLKLKQVYKVSELDHRDGVFRLKLSSKSKQADFSELVVGVSQQGLQFMQMKDQFDQITDIVFLKLELNKTLDNDLFEFIPPEGVDVYGGS